MPSTDLEIQSKGELASYLQRRMYSTYTDLRDKSEYERDRHPVKTYIIEFSPGDQLSLEQINESLIERIFTFQSGRGKNISRTRPAVERTRDNSLFKVWWSYKTQSKPEGEIIEAYFDVEPDTGEKRFWVIDSVAKADKLERIIEKVTKQSNDLDRIWLWPEFLNDIKRKGRFRSIDLGYDYREFEKEESEAEEINNEELEKYLKITVRGGNNEISDALAEILDTELLGRKVVPSKVGIRYEGRDGSASGNSEFFALEDVKYDGKILVKGTSANLHKELVSEIRRRYSGKVREIEEKYTIRLEGEDNKIQNVLGEPLYFDFQEKPIEDLHNFCNVVFSGNEPFSLWGVPTEIDDGLLVYAVDLKTGSKMNFQIYRDIITLSLEPNACGNSVVRFFTNVQQNFSCRVTAEDSDGNPIF